jgi:NADH-quinone oxidoreductase subunit H
MNIVIVIVKIIIAILALLGAAVYFTLYERRLVGRFQDRIGPNRVGPNGLLQPIADGIKLVLKEDIVPSKADPFIHALAPVLAVFFSMAAIVIIPIGEKLTVAGYDIPLVISNAGVLYFLAASSMAVYGVVLAGWGSANKYSMIGALRSTAQMISYELAMGLAVVGAVILWGSLSLVDMVRAQGFGNLREIVYTILAMPLFITFFITGLAETNRAPFDLPEGESELVAGYHTEFSGLKFAMFFLAEYANIIIISAIASTLFLGGWRGPGILGLGDLPIIWLAIKVLALCSAFVWVRATLPRIRYDKLMDFGWKFLLPVTLFWVMIVATVVAFWPIHPVG